jgi:hypothetical protein
VVCGTFFFDDVIDVRYVEICMYRAVVDIPGCIRYLSKYFGLSSLDDGYFGCASATPDIDPVNPNGFNYCLVQ